MEELFGIPLNWIMLALIAAFALLGSLLAVMAVRHPVAFKIGVRNIPRRPAQTALIVLGLMLGTLIISAAFGTGDTMTHTLRTMGLEHLGEVDEIIQSAERQGDPRSAPAYFDRAQFEAVQQALQGFDQVEGVAPLIIEFPPVIAPSSGQSEPRVYLLGMSAEHASGFDPVVSQSGELLSLDDLAPGEVYLDAEAARKLDVKEGEELYLYLGSAPTRVTVKAIYEKGGRVAREPTLLMPLPYLQALLDRQGSINTIVLSNRGDAIQGADYTDAVVSRLTPLLEEAGLEIEPVKQQALERADETGSAFTSIFLIFGLFSIAAGVLLIFLIFVMLAVERKREIGIARAVGTQRREIIRMFTFEGAVYSLLAASIGALLGVGVGYGMVRVMAVAFGQTDFQIIHHFNPRSLVIAYTLGMVFTFVVVALSAWRVSRINIVRAIRDLPEPPSTGRSWKGGGIRVLLLLLGFLLTAVGIQAAQFFPFMLGTSLIIIGAALLARWAGLRDRLVFTFAGVTLLLWWLLPSDIYDRLFPFLPEMKMGIEIFFLTGIMIVAGAVWTVIYNSDILLAAIIALIGRVRWLTPVLKTAISYPLHHKFRTGMALAMFSLVIFTMIFMSVMISASTAVFQDVERLSGGFHIRALTSYINPVPDLRAALEEGGEVASDDFAVIAAQSVVQAEVRQAGAASPEWHNYFLQGVDAAYLDNVTYEFALIAEGYDSPRQVWQALRDEPGLAVVDYTLVPSRANFNVGMELPEFQLEGFYVEDDILPPVEIEVRDRVTQQVSRLRVIGVLEPTAFFSLGIYTSRSTLDTVISQPLPPAIYWLRAKPGADVRQLSLALERQFLEHGMQTRVLQEIIQENSRINRMMNGLLQGFMGLGLVVGIAALGVIAARSVVERRQQIGMLRAIGFQRGMVQLSFLLESSFVALLGIVIGIVLGLWLSYEVVGYIARDIQGFRFQIPWLNILIIALIAYGASLLTTFLPAHQASRIYPAAALRYE